MSAMHWRRGPARTTTSSSRSAPCRRISRIYRPVRLQAAWRERGSRAWIPMEFQSLSGITGTGCDERGSDDASGESFAPLPSDPNPVHQPGSTETRSTGTSQPPGPDQESSTPVRVVPDLVERLVHLEDNYKNLSVDADDQGPQDEGNQAAGSPLRRLPAIGCPTTQEPGIRSTQIPHGPAFRQPEH